MQIPHAVQEALSLYLHGERMEIWRYAFALCVLKQTTAILFLTTTFFPYYDM